MGRSSLGPAEDAPDSLEVGGKTSEKLKPNRVALSRSVWDQIRIDYETSRETIAQIARRFGVSRGAISHRSRTEGWLPRRTRKRGPDDGQQDVLIRRLYRTIDRKLAQLEMRMSNDEDNLSIADHERETRALGQLIRNFEKVSGLETEQSGG